MTRADEIERQRQIAEVKLYAERLLHTAGVREEYPTPVDRIVEAAELVCSGELALLRVGKDTVPHQIWAKFKGSLSDLLSIVKGGLFTKEKVIFINPDAHVASIPFVKLHECIHRILPWQQHLFEFLDTDQTLSSETRFGFEREANIGGSHLLWQGDDYVKKAHDLPISTGAPVKLAEMYGGSIHSSMRYYAENHKEPIVLLVVREKGNQENNSHGYQLQYTVTSKAFEKIFGQLRISLDGKDQKLFEHSFLEPFWEGETRLKINQEEHIFRFFGYQTPYNIFVIMAPRKSVRRYGRSVIVVGSNT